MERHLKFPLYIDLDKKQNKEPNAVCVVPPKHGRYETVITNIIGYKVSVMLIKWFYLSSFSDPLRFLIDKTGDAYTNYNYTKPLK
jgi:hypothetical protein